MLFDLGASAAIASVKLPESAQVLDCTSKQRTVIAFTARSD